ncbi:MAG: c-type cytochrome [Xanthobacteraceae bacterium]
MRNRPKRVYFFRDPGGAAPAPTAPEMPAFAWVMNDDQVAAVVNYIRNSWGNSAPIVSSGDVRKERDALTERSD